MSKKLPPAIPPTAMRSAEPRLAAALADVADEPEAMRQATAAATKAAKSEHAETPADARRAEAIKLVRRFSLWGGVASMVPAPFFDIAAITAVQIQLLRRLSAIFDVPFSENRGKAILAGFVGAMIPASSGIGAASLMKGLPILGTAVSTVVMPTLAAGATYAIGMAFTQHFVSGGTLLDFNPPDYDEFIKEHTARAGVRPA
jgi:uncharacterized protein (DUF697 family)